MMKDLAHAAAGRSVIHLIPKIVVLSRAKYGVHAAMQRDLHTAADF
jgi:hypothetical protein